MCQVSDNSRSDTGGGSDGKGSTSGDSSEKFPHIKSANKKIRLIDVLRNYGLKIEKNHQRPTWSNNLICPLPSHKGAKERTPSFGYCFVTDHAYCLGCNFTGRAVEFIAAYEGITRSAVAEKILAQYGEDLSQDEFKEYDDDITPILLDGAKYLQGLIQENKHSPEKLQKIHKLIWWLDFYLQQKAVGKNIKSKELQYRIERVKELLDGE